MGMKNYGADTFSSDYDDTFVAEPGYEIRMPREPSVGSFTEAPFEVPFGNL
jgi:hypothetical protein